MASEETRLTIGLGEFAVSRDPSLTMIAYGLGSCVGVALYDPVVGLGGMIHVVLPAAPVEGSARSPTHFADTGIAYLLQEMERRGAKRSRIQAKIAGGARMFDVNHASVLDIGNRNVLAVKETLGDLGLTLVGADVGGNYGRTMHFFLKDGQVLITTYGRGQKIL